MSKALVKQRRVQEGASLHERSWTYHALAECFGCKKHRYVRLILDPPVKEGYYLCYDCDFRFSP